MKKIKNILDNEYKKVITRSSSLEVESTIRTPVNLGGSLPNDSSSNITLPYKMYTLYFGLPKMLALYFTASLLSS
jgi:hypothetical protein